MVYAWHIKLQKEADSDYLLTGDIIDKDKLLLSEKLDKLTPQQVA